MSAVCISKKFWVLSGALLLCAAATLSAQTPPTLERAVPQQVWTHAPGGNHFDGPKDIIYPTKTAPVDTRLNMYFGDWHDSLPHAMFGTLVVRDILTPGDNLSPPAPGAVLEVAKFLSYGTLGAGERTTPTAMKGLQVFFYVNEGHGQLIGDGKTIPIHKGNGFLVPEGLEFSMHNDGDSQLVVYMIGDPTYPGFVPGKTFLIKDENTMPPPKPATDSPFTNPGAGGHWAHITHGFFDRHGNGALATVGSIITVEILPLQLGEPHPHLPGKEEVWCEISGKSLAFVGPQLRMQHAGQAYILRPDGLTTHSNINIDEPGTKPVEFLWFSTNTGLSAAPH